MSGPEGVKKLSGFPREQLIERELFWGIASEVDLLEHLGAPSGESQPGLGHGAPRVFWDLHWPCGLVMGLQFEQLSQELLVHLDADDIDHALRHLTVELSGLTLLKDDDPELYASVCDPPDVTYELCRVDANGEREVIESELTERDAICRMEERRRLGEAGLEVAGGRVDLDGAQAEDGSTEGTEDGTQEVSEADAVAQALVERVAGSLQREPEPEPEPAVDSLPSTFDPGEEVESLEGFDEDAFVGGELLDLLAGAAESPDGPGEPPPPPPGEEPAPKPQRPPRSRDLLNRDPRS